MSRLVALGLTFLVTTAAAACDPDDGGAGVGGSGAGAEGGGGSGSGYDGGGGSGAGSDGGGGAPPACPEPTSGPTTHAGKVTDHQVWSADDSPHVVTERLDVVQGGVLEIEPCAVVEIAEGVNVNVAFPGTPTTGSLIAEGRADEPITIRGLDGARWGRIYAYTPGQIRLAHATIRDGGGAGATLVAVGNGQLPTHRGLFVDHVTIAGSAGPGIVLDQRFAFADGSESLTIEGAGNAPGTYPVRLDEHAVGTLPSGSYTGNAVDAILIDPRHALAEDAVWRDRGVPYHVGDAPNDHLTIGHGPQGSPPTTLVVEPGVTLAFHPGIALRIESATGAFPATGALVAEGTASAPILFTSSATQPQAGDWIGLWFGGVVSETTRLRHTRIEHTGADCGCVLVSCHAVTDYEGAVIMTQDPGGAFVTDSVIANGTGHGIVQGYSGAGHDFAGANAFEGLGGCEVTSPSQPQCPTPKPTCGG